MRRAHYVPCPSSSTSQPRGRARNSPRCCRLWDYVTFLEVVFFFPSASEVHFVGPFQVASDLERWLLSALDPSLGRFSLVTLWRPPQAKKASLTLFPVNPCPSGGWGAASLVVCYYLQVISRWLLSGKKHCRRHCAPIGACHFATKEKNGKRLWERSACGNVSFRLEATC